MLVAFFLLFLFCQPNSDIGTFLVLGSWDHRGRKGNSDEVVLQNHKAALTSHTAASWERAVQHLN